jgi:Cu2+-exporting ATPase
MFRDRFWISLLLSVPVVVWSAHIEALLDHTALRFPF